MWTVKFGEPLPLDPTEGYPDEVDIETLIKQAKQNTKERGEDLSQEDNIQELKRGHLSLVI